MRRGVRLPTFLVGVVDPAQAYLQKRSGRRPARRRSSTGAATYAPLTRADDGAVTAPASVPAAPVVPPDARTTEAHSRARTAALDRVLQDHRQLLDAVARRLDATGEAHLDTPSAEVRARVVRFRWGDSVLEVEGRRRPPEGGAWAAAGTRATDRAPGGGAVSNRARVPRHGMGSETAVHYLAGVLAELS